MIKYLLDTNVVLRFCNPDDLQHHLATEAIFYLLNQADECFLTAQVRNFIHFYHCKVMLERRAIALPKKERYAYGTLRDRKCFFTIGDRLK